MSCLALAALPSSQSGHLENRSTLSQQQAKPLFYYSPLLAESGARICTGKYLALQYTHCPASICFPHSCAPYPHCSLHCSSSRWRRTETLSYIVQAQVSACSQIPSPKDLGHQWRQYQHSVLNAIFCIIFWLLLPFCTYVYLNYFSFISARASHAQFWT